MYFYFFNIMDNAKCRIQLAVNVQIPADCGGLGGKAIYIGTIYLGYELCFLSILVQLSPEYSVFSIEYFLLRYRRQFYGGTCFTNCRGMC